MKTELDLRLILSFTLVMGLVAVFCFVCGGFTIWLTYVNSPLEVGILPTASPTPVPAGATNTVIPNTPISPSQTPQPSPTDMPEQPSERDQIIAWLEAEALPLQAVEPSDQDDYADLMPLKELIGDARIVALGEATHGTHEFFTMKHRLVRFLIEEMGFNMFAIEDDWVEATNVNDYVFHGEGDASEAMLAGITYWTWSTEEVLDMVTWMRAHNADPGDAPKISFHGFDSNKGQKKAIDHVIAYLQNVDPDYAPTARSNYECFYIEEEIYTWDQQSTQSRDACRDTLEAVYDRLDEKREAYIDASSKEAFDLALQNARVILQAEMNYWEFETNHRDHYMAENVGWLLEQAGPEAKIILWAHNGHVCSQDPETSWACVGMGYHLRQEYQNDLFVIGFDFSAGNVTAVGPTNQLGSHNVPPAPPESFGWYAHQMEYSDFMLSTQKLGSNQIGANWLSQAVQIHDIGSMYDPETYPGLSPYNLKQAFDLLIYIDSTTASQLLGP